jgi:hypothetical protein
MYYLLSQLQLPPECDTLEADPTPSSARHGQGDRGRGREQGGEGGEGGTKGYIAMLLSTFADRVVLWLQRACSETPPENPPSILHASCPQRVCCMLCWELHKQARPNTLFGVTTQHFRVQD